MSVDISQTICEAIDLIINKRLSTAPFNKTIEGKINNVVNVNQRKYKVTYTGGPGTIVAYGLQGSSYKKNDYVFILMPSNGDCIILGKRETLQQANVSNRDSYTKIGETIVYRDNNTAVTASFGNLCSYGNNGLNPSNRDQVVFISNKAGADNSDEALKNYIKSSPNGIVLSAIVSTRLAATQVGGNYGVKFKIVFHRKTDYTKFRQQEYVLDVRDIVGVNPYLVQEAMYVEHIIPASQFDFENFAYVKQVKAFCDGFPYDDSIANLAGNNKSPYYDITVVNPSICTAFVISPEDSKDYHLFLEAEKGNFLGITDSAGHAVNSLPVKAVLKHDGEQSVTDVIYRWFVKDESIGVGNDNYHQYAGPGWRYINKKKSDGKNRYSVRTFNFTTEIPNPLTQGWDKNNYPIVNNLTTVKCIAELGGDRWENETQIHFDNGIKIWITNTVVSNLENNNYIFNHKARFSFKCNYQDDQQVTNDNPQKGFDTDRYNYKLSWKLIANQRDQRTIIKTNNNEYFYLGDQYNNTGSGNERLFIEDIAHGVLSCSIERQLKEPTGSPYIFLGGTEINFYYKPSTGNYYIDIQNGNRLMQYNQNGKFSAPDTGLTIDPLLFSLIDPNGNEVLKLQKQGTGSAIYSRENSKIITWLWEVPKTNTLIKVEGTPEANSGEINIPEEVFSTHNYYKGKQYEQGMTENDEKILGSLTWVPQDYNVKYTNNTIKLYVLFKENLDDNARIQIETSTVFTPIRMGDPGTNGTNTIAFIKPYNNTTTKAALNCKRTYFLAAGSENTAHYTDTNENVTGYRFFLQRDNENVTLKSSESGPISWTLPLKAKKAKNVNYISCYSQNATQNYDWTTITKGTVPTGGNWNINTLNILRATFSPQSTDLKYYAEYPICCVRGWSIHNRIRLKQTSGFTYVVYSQAGVDPRYDGNNEFELEVFNNGTDLTSQCSYDWSIFDTDNSYLQIKGDTNTKTCVINPKPKFNGQYLQNAILCHITYNNSNAYILIPIYFLLNRYSHANLNKWDGNSIQIKQEDGFILAPQVGAGKKNDNSNTFTGVLMGEVITGNSGAEESKVGLFTYSEGVRTIFLDANTGIGYFGQTGKGQIEINGQKAKITGGEYNWNSSSGSGLQIDLADPHIRYGNKKFYVNNDGLLHATGAYVRGDIEASSFTANLSQQVNNTIDSKTAGFVVRHESAPTSGNNIIRDSTGIGVNQEFSQGDLWHQYNTYKIQYPQRENNTTKVVTFRLWTVDNDNLNFGVTKLGTLFAKNAFIDGNIYSISGKIGGWSLGNGFLTSNATGGYFEINTSNSVNKKDYFLWGGPNSTNTSRTFSVSKKGKLYAQGAEIQGKISASSGNIGGWQLQQGGSGKLTYLNHSTSTRRIYLSPDASATNAIAVGQKEANESSWTYPFRVTPEGVLHATGAEIKDGNITLNITSQNNLVKNIKGPIIDGLAVQIQDNDKVTEGASIKRGYAGLGALKTTGAAIKQQFGGKSPSSNGTYYLRFWGGSGGVAITNLNFAVGIDGHLYAKNATISGDITANSGSFTGTIKATSGEIGDWQISTGTNKNLTNGNIELGKRTISQQIMNTNFGRNAQRTAMIWGSLDGTNTNTNFMVDNEGILYAKGAYIRSANIDAASIQSGTINAARIPNLNASKINAGTLSVERISASGDVPTSIKWLQSQVVTNIWWQDNAHTTLKFTTRNLYMLVGSQYSTDTTTRDAKVINT